MAASADISSAYQFYITWWVASQDVVANTSTVTVQWRVRKTGNDSSSYNSNARMNASVDDQYLVKTDQYLTNWDGGRGWDMRTKPVGFDYCYFSSTKTYTHNADGTKQISIYGYFEPNTGLSTQKWNNVQVRETATLPAIPRASTVSATGAQIGSASVITIKRMAQDLTHTLRYSFGSLSGVIAEKTAITTMQWKVPESFFAQIPNARAGTATITCETYSGSARIGSSTCAVTVTVPASCAPSITGTVVDSNSVTKALTGDQNKLVRYFSTAYCTASVSVKNGATPGAVYIAGVQAPGGSRSIANVENNSFVFSATDSRGFSSSVTVAKTMVDYVRLTCSAVMRRVTPTSDSASLTLTGNYFNASFGAAANSLTVTYQIDSNSAKAITPTTEGNTWRASLMFFEVSYTKSYKITVTVKDKLMSVTRTVTLNRGVPVFDWGAGSFRVNVPLGVTGGFETGGSPMGRPNLLDNWYFIRPVNQRGKTTYSGRGYTIDRIYAEGGTVSVGSGGVTFSGGTFIQRVEKTLGEELRGRVATLSVLMADGNLYSATGTLGSSISTALSNGATCGVAYYSSEIQFLRLAVPSGVSVKLAAVKLELGAGSTLVRKENDVWVLNDPPPDLATELAKCQRYFEKTTSPYTVPGGNSPIMVSFLQEKRATPTVTIDASSSTKIASSYVSTRGFRANRVEAGWADFNWTAEADL